MNYLQVEGIYKSFGDKNLFEDVSFGIQAYQKVALVANNGTGKSTLLDIIMGKEQPDRGKVTFNKEVSYAYLSQNPVFNPEHTVLEAIFSTQATDMQMIKLYHEALLTNNLEQIEELSTAIDNAKAWDIESKVTQILSKVGIMDFDKQIKHLSGGQKKRVALASVLVNEPNLLIVDEPTNHLDLDTIEWLEGYLSRSSLTLLMVTHDRYFLDNICDEIIELDNQSCYKYKGNYSYYVEKKAERMQLLQTEIEKAQNLYTKELDWMRRQPKARSTKAKSRIDAFYDVEDKAKQRINKDEVELNVRVSRIGGKILELHSISKKWENKLILDKFTYTFKKGEKVGIIGKNGVGKTTFLQLITQEIEPDSGTVKVGETVIYGYYNQDGMEIKDDKRIIEVVRDIADFIPLADGKTLTASQLLTRFLFPPSTQYNYVYKLSGGEKRRLYLLTLLMKNPNFLILDEPTNDLDISTLSILEDFLQDFPGCVIIVSHDRYFMDRIVDHLFIFEGNGVITDRNGNYSDYRDEQKLQAKALNSNNKVKKNNTATVITQAPVIESTSKKKVSYKEQKEYEQLLTEIENLEKLKVELEKKLTSNLEYNDLQKLTNQLKDNSTSLETKTMRWIELGELIE